MKKVLIALLVVLFMISTTSVIYAKNCKKGRCANTQKKEGCPKADPNSK